MSQPGTLYIVATPIGNLADITYRAVDTLKGVDWIACEDTRHSRRLLDHYAITTPVKSYHQHNESARTEAWLSALQGGQSIALISDAGTPLINDPGYVIVSACRDSGISVVPIPGACAALAALSVSGLPTDRFLYVGFLSVKSGERKKALDALLHESATLVFYESPKRVRKLMADISAILGDERQVVVARELTKSFESFYAGCARELMLLDEKALPAKGEFVVMVAGVSDAPLPDEIELTRVLTILLEKMSVKDAVALAVKLTGLPKSQVYARALSL